MDSKTYAIYNSSGIKMGITTSDLEQVEANLSAGDSYEEVTPGFNPGYYKVVGGKLIKKTEDELKALFSRN